MGGLITDKQVNNLDRATAASRRRSMRAFLQHCGALLRWQLKLVERSLRDGVRASTLRCHYSQMLICDWLVSPIRNTQGFGLMRSESLRTNYLENIFFAATAHHKNIFPADTNRRINAIVNWIILKVNDLPVNILIFVLWVLMGQPPLGNMLYQVYS